MSEEQLVPLATVEDCVLEFFRRLMARPGTLDLRGYISDEELGEIRGNIKYLIFNAYLLALIERANR